MRNERNSPVRGRGRVSESSTDDTGFKRSQFNVFQNIIHSPFLIFILYCIVVFIFLLIIKPECVLEDDEEKVINDKNVNVKTKRNINIKKFLTIYSLFLLFGLNIYIVYSQVKLLKS
jgi:Ca2+/Na+ antiporter